MDSATANDNPFVFIPLHKGADDFMSDKNFRKFYWASHLKVVLGLINEGLVPFHFVEGRYNNRLDVLADSGIPPRSTFWNFDQIDMVQAKKKVGGWAAIGGNIQGSVLTHAPRSRSPIRSKSSSTSAATTAATRWEPRWSSTTPPRKTCTP